MDLLNPLPAVVALFLAFSASFLLVKKFGAPPLQGRFASIDGLRGYLAFFVFLHHAAVWYFYLKTGEWKVPPSNLYTHFGQGGVAFFFMITGFLFFSKIIEGKTKEVDWLRLYVSRFLRLVPLYFFLLFLVLIVVAYLGNGQLNESVSEVATEIIRWLGFAVFGQPNINGVNASHIVAGVVWSLPYEWLFYFTLPLLALAVRVIPPIQYIILSVAVTAAFVLWYDAMTHMVIFFGGIVTSVIARYDSMRRLAATRLSSFIAIGCVSAAVGISPSAYGLVPLFFYSVAFALIACGNTLFGILTCEVSRALGELAYSLYLLHGIILFVIFTFLFGITESQSFSPMTYWLIILGTTPFLIGICFLSFRFIEHPSMQKTTRVTAWIRSRFLREALV